MGHGACAHCKLELLLPGRPCERERPPPGLLRAGEVEHPQLPAHPAGLQGGLEPLQEEHHGGVGLEVGEVVVHPQQEDARDLR